ncbi:hypothetical protein [Sphingobacterium paucimobilis]|uniref:Chromosome segregation protein SMC n=1 Tax=Sphingobacterium paucimobilis HER1398 TaxID=1346330 RepID=U2J7M9_9SPHI|nr:hypothetical protein [Sphingobacterium paucimobilis]ERJ58653.1 hypothetical protein M472_07735 [Sphingobacterium paucimobilis HER1398]
MEVKSTSVESEVPDNKKDNSKIYFFMIAIASLLATNIYFYVKFKSSGEKLYTVALQKENLQIEIDRIEAELDNIKNQNIEGLPDNLIQEELFARKIIDDLRAELENSNISDAQIQAAKDQIQKLKNNVSSLKDEAGELKLQNDILLRKNKELSSSVREKNEQMETLKQRNERLSEKVSIASSVKVSSILVNGVEKTRKGDLEIETKAKRVDDLQIKFSIADNPLAKEGSKEIFVRIIDPQGNLIAKAGDVFSVHGDKLQYTFKEAISFTNRGEEYQFLWRDTNRFKKGAYTVLLYADDAIMGRSSVVLK